MRVVLALTLLLAGCAPVYVCAPVRDAEGDHYLYCKPLPKATSR